MSDKLSLSGDIIAIKAYVPIYLYGASEQDDPIVRMLCKLKKKYTAKHNASVTHIICRPKTNGGFLETNQIVIQFLVSNHNGDLNAEDIARIRNEYSNLAMLVLAPYINFLTENNIQKETDLTEEILAKLQKLEDLSKLQVDELVGIAKETSSKKSRKSSIEKYGKIFPYVKITGNSVI